MKPLFRAKPANSAEPALIEQAFERYYPAIFRYLRFCGADADTANDLTAATFERALSSFAQYDPARAQLQTWLFVIARRLAANHWKTENRFEPLDDEFQEETPGPEQEIMLTQNREQILTALQILDPRARELIALKFGGPLNNRQVAELTGLTESNVGVILYRSLLKLRAALIEAQEISHE